MFTKYYLSVISSALLISFSPISSSSDVATESLGGGYLVLTPLQTYSEAVLRVSGDNLDETVTFGSGDNISFDAAGLPDGDYAYSLDLVSPQLASDLAELQEMEEKMLNEGAEDKERYSALTQTIQKGDYAIQQSGAFKVEGGSVLSADNDSEVAAD